MGAGEVRDGDDYVLSVLVLVAILDVDSSASDWAPTAHRDLQLCVTNNTHFTTMVTVLTSRARPTSA